MKYKIGDKVTIVSVWVYPMSPAGNMDKYFSKILTIEDIVKSGNAYYYKMREDNNRWYWSDGMIVKKISSKSRGI